MAFLEFMEVKHEVPFPRLSKHHPERTLSDRRKVKFQEQRDGEEGVGVGLVHWLLIESWFGQDAKVNNWQVAYTACLETRQVTQISMDAMHKCGIPNSRHCPVTMYLRH